MGRRRNSQQAPNGCDLPRRDPLVPPLGQSDAAEQRSAHRSGAFPLAQRRAESRWLLLAVCGLLLLAVGLVFAQTVRSGFINFDDGLYVYENSHVLQGLSLREIDWVFTRLHAGYWIPLTWISFMLDNQLYGLGAGGFHLTNVLLHAATVILLLLVLWRMTGDFWPSALAAAIFAVHPLRVESVAWVTERKDVLSGLFFVLALGAYVSYVRHQFSVARYLAIMLFLALGLMAKPILVTLPLVLLLLDCWPLGRFSSSSLRHPMPPDGRQSLDQTPPHCNGGDFPGRANFLAAALRRFPLLCQLVIEKLPLLLLVAIFCVVTLWTQADARAVNDTLPPGWRLGNALVSYVAYLGQFVYPLGLAVFYPHPRSNLPIGQVCAAVAALALISAVGVACRRRCPYMLMGWLWYLGMLVPVIGLVQAERTPGATASPTCRRLGCALPWLGERATYAGFRGVVAGRAV